jgi:hypothetical protein
MTDPAHHRTKLRRLRILQALAAVAPNPMGEQALLARLQVDHELDPDLARVRADLAYLDHSGLVRLVRVPSLDWRAARLTDAGRAWLTRPGDLGLEIHSPDYCPPARDGRGRPSGVTALDPETRAWLDQELARGRYTDKALAAELTARGYDLSYKAVNNYAKRKREMLADTRAKAEEKASAVRALAGFFSDEADIPALLQSAQGFALMATVDAISAEQYNSDKDTLAGLVKALPALGRGFREIEKQKIEREARRKEREEAADRVDQAAHARGLGAEDAAFWRNKVLMGM